MAEISCGCTDRVMQQNNQLSAGEEHPHARLRWGQLSCVLAHVVPGVAEMGLQQLHADQWLTAACQNVWDGWAGSCLHSPCSILPWGWRSA